MSAESTLPHRGTGMSDDAVPDTDPSDVRISVLEPIGVLPVWKSKMADFELDV